MCFNCRITVSIQILKILHRVNAADFWTGNGIILFFSSSTCPQANTNTACYCALGNIHNPPDHKLVSHFSFAGVVNLTHTHTLFPQP